MDPTETLRLKCTYCDRPGPQLMCKLCAASFDRYMREEDDGTIYSVMSWAARRARFFEQRRQRQHRRKR